MIPSPARTQMFYDKRGLRMEKTEVYVVMDQEEGRVTGQDERRNESSIVFRLVTQDYYASFNHLNYR